MKTGRMMAGAGQMDVIQGGGASNTRWSSPARYHQEQLVALQIFFENIANQQGLYLQAVQWRRRINV